MNNKYIEIASVTNGCSIYNDDVWHWLIEHRSRFGVDENIHSDYFDFIGAWGLLALCGCKIKCYGEKDAPKKYRTNYGSGVTITFSGTPEELVSRLNKTGSALE